MSELKYLTKQYWDKRYVDKTTVWDLGLVSPPIKLWIDRQSNKSLKILVPGAGKGHEVIYAFKKAVSYTHLTLPTI